ncbi:MAG TPA: L-seryl-tRNA(Sec) selenium transferase, partial [Longimicrobiaceae bacterium]|nr:L-seryl-tRNA(Sec) selenium transferase [Longimicrobiaceae bacterium]
VVLACVREAESLRRPFPRRVVNGTGVLVHTNLGRAPLGELVERLDTRALAGYSDLEWDAGTGGRGSRDLALQRQLRLLTGAEAALVVNNCASALFLALNTLAADREVLVSRSELVEIGGSFRVPEIMEASGCRLREVGTTNRTRLDDFERHARPGASVLLKVHQSNFVQRGFVEQVGVEELVALGRRLAVPVVEDNGSGLVGMEEVATLADEPRVVESLRRGVDVVCCSADKLFGGVQAGILLGGAERLEAMRKNPLYRVLRLDKVRMALLDATLKQHLAGRAAELPLWRLFHADIVELAARIERLRLPGPETRWASCRRVPLRGTLGGGTNPEADFESLGLELVHRDLAAEGVRRRFAAREVPVVGYVKQDRFHLDLRTVLPDDLPELQRALDELGASAGAEG